MNNFRDSFLQRIVIYLLFALIFVACGRGGGAARPAELEPAELSYVTDLNRSQTEQALLDRFEEQHPGVTIAVSSYSDSPLGYARAGTPPDVMVLWSGSWLHDGIGEELFTDLTEVSTSPNLDMPYEEQLQAQAPGDGGRYLSPLGYHWRGLYYNVELFDELGLTPPQTWEEMIVAADTLRNNGVVPFALPASNPWAASIWFDYLNIRLNGPEFQQALNRGEILYTDERVRNVFQTWQGLLEGGYFTSDLGISDGFASAAALVRGDGETPLTQEKAAMALLAPFDFEELPQLFQNELAVFAFPIMDSSLPRGEVINDVGYVVPRGAVNRAQALEFVRYITSSEATGEIARLMSGESKFVPVDTTNRDELPDTVQQGLAIVEQAETVVLPSFWANPDSMVGPLSSEMGRFLRSARGEEANVEEMLARLEEARLNALAAGDFE